MSSILDSLTQWLASISDVVPLPWFVAIGAFIEEVIAPIPSPLVMTLAGSLAGGQNSSLMFLAFLALLGSIGKTLGSWLVYVVADKAEDIVVGKFGRLLGVSHSQIEGLGKLLNNGARDDVVLFLLRAVPIIPTAPVSVMCGLIKINLRTYLVSTFFGTLVRNIIYLYLGYTGAGALNSLNENFDSWEGVGYLTLFVLFAALVAWMYFKRSKGGGEDIVEKLSNMFKKSSSKK